ncbi:MAG: hypothetical protein ABIU63_16690, partial [Chitinophagaceae bacterium]
MYKYGHPLEKSRKIKIYTLLSLLAIYIAACIIWPGYRMWSSIAMVVVAAGVWVPKHFFRSLLILLGILLVSFLLVQTPPVQDWLAGQASARLSKGLGTRVSVKHVKFTFFSKMQMEGVYVEDQNKDTLLYAGKLRVNINDWFFLRDTAVLKYIGLEDATIHLNRTDSIWNYQFLINYFFGPPQASTGTDTAHQKSIQLQLQKAELKNIHLLKKDGWRGEDMGLYLASLKLDAREVDFNKKLVDINELDLVEPIFSISNYPGRRTYKPPSTVRDPRDTALYWNPGGWKIMATSIMISNGAFKDEKKS